MMVARFLALLLAALLWVAPLRAEPVDVADVVAACACTDTIWR